MKTSQLDNLQEWAIPALRVVISIIFIGEAIVKLTVFGVQGFAGFLASIGLPAATVLAVLLIALELFGGLAILLGIFTRLAAALLTIEMVVAIFTVHLSHGFQQANGGWEWPFAVFGGTLAIALAGPGKLALASRFTRTRRSALTPAIE